MPQPDRPTPPLPRVRTEGISLLPDFLRRWFGLAPMWEMRDKNDG